MSVVELLVNDVVVVDVKEVVLVDDEDNVVLVFVWDVEVMV